MLIDDYKPTKRVGIEELEGATRIFRERVEWAFEEADSRHMAYLGAWLVLHLLLVCNFKYPKDLLEAFENLLEDHLAGDLDD